jgi:hypothetical protein
MQMARRRRVSKEPEHVRKMYGDGVHGRQILISRLLDHTGTGGNRLSIGILPAPTELTTN